MSTETTHKTTLNHAEAMAQYLMGYDAVLGVDLFGSVARNGAGNDLDLAVEVDPEIYTAYLKKKKYTEEHFGDYFIGDTKEASMVCTALGIAAAGRLVHLGNQHYPTELSVVDALVIPVGSRTESWRQNVQADYGFFDPNFMNNIVNDMVKLQ